MNKEFYSTSAPQSAGRSRARQALDYLPVDPPQGTDFVEVAPHVHWGRVPLRMSPHHINVWLLEDGPGTALVDTGMDCDIGRDYWTRAAKATPLRERPLSRVLVTHGHADHIGLAAWLEQTFGVPVRSSDGTRRMVAETLGDNGRLDKLLAYLRTHRIGEVDKLVDALSGIRFRAVVSGIPTAGEPLRDGDAIRIGASQWTAMLTEGHAAGHLCYFDSDRHLLISGDQVLPTISPNIGLHGPPAGRDPLGDYLASLRRLATLPEDTLVLPAHGRPFRCLHVRLAELAAHHRSELDLLVESCASPRDAGSLLGVMFPRELPGFHRFLAIGELFAHLAHLVRLGELRNEGNIETGPLYVRA